MSDEHDPASDHALKSIAGDVVLAVSQFVQEHHADLPGKEKAVEYSLVSLDIVGRLLASTVHAMAQNAKSFGPINDVLADWAKHFAEGPCGCPPHDWRMEMMVKLVGTAPGEAVRG